MNMPDDWKLFHAYARKLKAVPCLCQKLTDWLPSCWASLPAKRLNNAWSCQDMYKASVASIFWNFLLIHFLPSVLLSSSVGKIVIFKWWGSYISSLLLIPFPVGTRWPSSAPVGKLWRWAPPPSLFDSIEMSEDRNFLCYWEQVISHSNVQWQYDTDPLSRLTENLESSIILSHLYGLVHP